MAAHPVADRERELLVLKLRAERVRRLHYERGVWCNECDRRYPCPTIRIHNGLDGDDWEAIKMAVDESQSQESGEPTGGPEFEVAAGLTVKSGENLVVAFANPIDRMQADLVKAQLEQRFPGVEVTVLGGAQVAKIEGFRVAQRNVAGEPIAAEEFE
jgi:hypothetical protein